VTGLFIQNRSHILFPLHINIKNCYICVTRIANEFNNNVNVNVQVILILILIFYLHSINPIVSTISTI